MNTIEKIDYKIGDKVNCRVVSHKPYGVFVQIDKENFGLIKVPNFEDDHAFKYDEFPAIGSKLKCIIIEIEKNDSGLKINLSMKKKDYKRF